MGYSYGQNYETGRWNLACDDCGDVGGVRKRTCTWKVRSSSHRTTDGRRHTMAYCSPPALCGPCFKKHGPGKKLHARCEEGARESQARYDEDQALLDSGAFMVASAWGSWHDDVPDGKTGVLFTNKTDERRMYLVDSDEYGGSGRYRTLDEYESAERLTSWEGRPV